MEEPEDEIFIQRRFTKVTDDGNKFKDAIVLPEDEYNDLTEAEIQDIKDERFENWKEQVAIDSSSNSPLEEGG